LKAEVEAGIDGLDKNVEGVNGLKAEAGSKDFAFDDNFLTGVLIGAEDLEGVTN
jgi:hypothetical protein